MRKLLYSLGAIVVIGLGLGGAATLKSTAIWAEAPKAADPAALVKHEAQTRVFAIENMTCAACPFTVKKAMARVDGVKEVSVDFDAKTATAVFDPLVANIEDIATASTDVGYPATPISEDR